MSDKDASWYNLIRFRYGWGLEALCVNEANHVLFEISLWWRDVRAGCASNFLDQTWFSNYISCKLGNSESFRFWDHFWLGSIPLRELFPRVYGVCSAQSFSVTNMTVWVDAYWSWKLRG